MSCNKKLSVYSADNFFYNAKNCVFTPMQLQVYIKIFKSNTNLVAVFHIK
jgi:hypothetical protein